MNSRATARFWKLYGELPRETQSLAGKLTGFGATMLSTLRCTSSSFPDAAADFPSALAFTTARWAGSLTHR